VGGGTPSLLSNNSFLQITSSLNNRFNGANAEFTIECDPGTFDREKL
jgi:coproporphyrinogen III oxidase-like Fe-S oxidoreductase